MRKITVTDKTAVVSLIVKVGFFLLVASIISIAGHWAYFNMRYKVIIIGEYRNPVLFDTWTHERSRIKAARDPDISSPAPAKTEAPAAPAPAPTLPSAPPGYEWVPHERRNR